MGRSKLNLEFIAKHSKRLATFKNRKESVFKKARELGTLCDIRLCVVIESPDMPGYQVFPSDEEARELLHMFNNMPKKGKSATPSTPEPEPEQMLRQQVIKAREQLVKLEIENRELESEILLHEYITGARSRTEIGSEEARDILWVVEKKLRAVRARIDVLSLASAIAPQPDKDIVEDTVDTELRL